ncbi:hypothetical protein Nepgr_006706 [Nepenthes gracilis]|uniref:Uncharacterized protein n=1 Tax=Nepenthes gracilis TaxID=150966 RepID=A0AAD3S618_NEPGR|nr:hypothetical protein Nepgr_006706 [Nepenthes gracilis]
MNPAAPTSAASESLTQTTLGLSVPSACEDVALSPPSPSCAPQAGSAARCCCSLRSRSLDVPDSVSPSVLYKSASTSESARPDSLPGAASVNPNVAPAAGSPVNPRSTPSISWAHVAKGSGNIHFSPLQYFPPPAEDGPMRPPVEVMQQCSEVARMCVEVGRGDPLPSKIQILTGAADSATTMEVEIIYHSNPARRSSALLSNQKRASISLPLTQAPGVEGICAAVQLPLDQAPGLDGGGCHAAHVLADVNLASQAGFKPSVSGSELQDGLEKGSFECGLDGSGVDNSASDEPTERSVLDVFDSINSFAILQDPAEFDVQGLQCGPPIELSCNTSVLMPGTASEDLVLVEMDSGLAKQSAHESEFSGGVDELSSMKTLPVLAERFDADSAESAPEAGFSSWKAETSKDEMLEDLALDQASSLRRVRFSPEILTAEALSSAPHRRRLAPCSDICHPVKSRRSKLGFSASEDVPVVDGPSPGAVIECHDPSIPPSDGVTPEMEPVSVIDPDITPSPISQCFGVIFFRSDNCWGTSWRSALFRLDCDLLDLYYDGSGVAMREFPAWQIFGVLLLGRSGLTRVVAGAKNFRCAAFDFRFLECLCKWVPE